MSNPAIAKHVEQLQTWLRAAKESRNRVPNSFERPGLSASSYEFVRRELSRHAATVNERNSFATLPSGLLCRILFFTRIEDCIHVMQSCSLLRSRLLELPQLWAAISANGADLNIDGVVERTSAVARLSWPEPLLQIRVIWTSKHSAALTLLLRDTLARTQSLDINVPLWLRASGWLDFLSHAYNEYDTLTDVTEVTDALIVPAPLLKSFRLTFYQPVYPGFTAEHVELPTSIFAGEAGMLRECSLADIKLPPAGCLAFANVRRFHWSHHHLELGKTDVLSMLNSFPQLEVLRITATALSWDAAVHNPPLQRSVPNVQLQSLWEMDNIPTFLVDLGVQRFAFDERAQVPDINVWNDLASSPDEVVFTTIAIGLQLCEVAARFPSSDRDLLLRCRPARVADYFHEILPGMPTVPTLSMLTSLCIHEFFWPPAAESIHVAPGVTVPPIVIPSLPALLVLKILLASCLDYRMEQSDATGVLQQQNLRIWDTPRLESLHVSYHLFETCLSPRFHWDRKTLSCSCKETLTLSLLDLHAFVQRFVTSGHSNPRRLRHLTVTGVEPVDPDQGVAGMRLLSSLADEVRVSPTSEPENCDTGIDIWLDDDLESIFRDKLPVRSQQLVRANGSR